MLSQSVTNPAGQTPNAAAPCSRSKGSNAPRFRYVPWGTSTPCVHSPWQVSHGSGISNTLGSLPQHKLHFHSLLIGLSGLLSTLTPGVPGFTSCLNCGGRTQEHLHLFASPNVYHMNDTAKFNWQLEKDSGPLDLIAFAFCFVCNRFLVLLRVS